MTMSPLMIFHVAMGTAAVFSGATALFAPKGARLHRAAGNVFFISMLGTSAAGAYIGFQIPDQFLAFLAGVLAFYLTATAWMTVMRPAGKTGFAEFIAFLFIAATGAGLTAFGLEALNSEAGLKYGYSSEPYFFLGGVALLAAALDLSIFIRKGVAGRQRIARHLWRMCFALFIAVGSLFTGPGAKAFPEALRETQILSAPEPIVGLLMLFWLVRVLFTKWYEKSSTPVIRSGA